MALLRQITSCALKAQDAYTVSPVNVRYSNDVLTDLKDLLKYLIPESHIIPDINYII